MNQVPGSAHGLFRFAGGTLLAFAVYGVTVALLNNVAPEVTRLGVAVGIVWPDHPQMTHALWDFGGWLLLLLISGALATAVLARLCHPRMLWCALFMAAVLLVFAILQRSDLYLSLTGGRAVTAWDAMMRRDLHSPVGDFESFVVFPFAPWLCAYVFTKFANRRVARQAPEPRA